MAIGHCFECGSEMQIGMYDDAALSQSIVIICSECKDEVPEACIWDVSKLEEAHEDWGEEDHPNLINNIPNLEDEDWIVRNRYESKEIYVDHLKASWTGKIPDGAFEDISVDEYDEKWQIFVHDADDEEAIEEAREYIRTEK